MVIGLLVVACGHSEAFDSNLPIVGPSGPGPDVRLTYNPDQDYWPTFTEDGQGILYSFIPAGSNPEHRCVGLLPAAGGTATWQLCDNRATQSDSVSSFPAYALGSDGRLLYVEATARRGAESTTPARVALFLADSAKPFNRRAILTFPTFAGSTPIAWLADVAWTGPTTFIALGLDFSASEHCRGCSAIDTIFYGEAVVRGTIGATGATLTAVSGTAGATGYSLAEGGASIAFTRRDDRSLHRVPSAGGQDTVIAVVSSTSSVQLLGVSCRGSICIVAADPVTLTSGLTTPATYPAVRSGPTELRAVSLSTGLVQVLRTTAGIVATPQISPIGGNVVAQVGGGFGHLQSVTNAGSDLHLYLGLVP